MSARCSGNVWKHSRHKGSDLLVLLAIADYAKDDGTGAWPSIAGLAEKTRLSERNIQYILRKLEESGELTVDRHGGPKGCHLYNVTVGGAKIAPVEGAKFAGAKIAPGATQRIKGVQPSAEGGAIAIAPDPLKDPSIKPSIKAALVEGSDFPTFWSQFKELYPARDGKRVGIDSTAKEAARQLRPADYPAILKAARHYRDSGRYAVDPARFFKSRDYPNGLWREWTEPTQEVSTNGSHRGSSKQASGSNYGESSGAARAGVISGADLDRQARRDEAFERKVSATTRGN